MNKKLLILIWMSMLLLVAINARADILFLKNGSMVECNIIKETEDSYTVEILGGKTEFTKSEIHSVSRGESSEEQVKKFEEEQKSKGLIKYEDRWITKDAYNFLQLDKAKAKLEMQKKEEQFDITTPSESKRIKKSSSITYSKGEYYRKAKEYERKGTPPYTYDYNERIRFYNLALGEAQFAIVETKGTKRDEVIAMIEKYRKKIDFLTAKQKSESKKTSSQPRKSKTIRDMKDELEMKRSVKTGGMESNMEIWKKKQEIDDKRYESGTSEGDGKWYGSWEK